MYRILGQVEHMVGSRGRASPAIRAVASVPAHAGSGLSLCCFCLLPSSLWSVTSVLYPGDPSVCSTPGVVWQKGTITALHMLSGLQGRQPKMRAVFIRCGFGPAPYYVQDLTFVHVAFYEIPAGLFLSLSRHL